MDQDPDSDDDEMEVFKLAALADDEREAQADAETRANEEAAAQDEANAEATAQAAQLYSLGLSDEEANAIMPKGKRPADSSGSSDDSSGSSDDGSCHGGGGGRKKKKRRQRKKKKGDVGEDESTDRANLVRLIGPARMAAFTAQHDTLPLEELRSVWRLHQQWDELLEVFYKIQGPPRCGNTKKKAVRNKLAQNEQQRRDIAAEILRIKKGEFDFRRDEEGVANAELRPRSCYRPLLTMQKGWCPQAFASLLLGTVLNALAASLRDVVHARAILATTTMRILTTTTMRLVFILWTNQISPLPAFGCNCLPFSIHV